MRITQRELTALLRLFGNGSLKTKLAALVVVISAVLGLFYTGTAGGQGVIEGRVVSVADGDTLTVLALGNSPEKIRFAFIDAPEKTQPHGQAAKQALSARVFGRQVKVEVVEKDRYGRHVGRVWLDHVDVNLAQVQDGYAWHYAQYAKKTSRAVILPPTSKPSSLPVSSIWACGPTPCPRRRGIIGAASVKKTAAELRAANKTPAARAVRLIRARPPQAGKTSYPTCHPALRTAKQVSTGLFPPRDKSLFYQCMSPLDRLACILLLPWLDALSFSRHV